MTWIRVTDSTLRDGSHSTRHRYTAAQVTRIVELLDRSRVPVIEVGHGDGLGGSSFNYGFSASNEYELIAAAAQAAQQSTVATLLLPGIGLASDLRATWDAGARLVRVATHSTEADISAQHIGLARELGFEVNGFLMMSHMTPPEVLAEQALLMESYGAQAVYIVDSAGALVPGSARDRVRALRAALQPQTKVGFHAHDNLGCGVGNSLAAVEEGAELIDGSVGGLGAGAGNQATELFAAAADTAGVQTGIDVYALAAAADEIRELVGVTPRHDASSLAIGHAGVYSSFLLHADRAAERFGVPATEILIELGRRKVVGGQEDMILDVAAELARRREPVLADDAASSALARSEQ
jgi:4-hydroxy 2-oxovalerate aldolase